MSDTPATPTRIPPTVGRNVHYYPDGVFATVEHAALIAAVNHDGTVNLAWFDHLGQCRNAVGVPLLQEGDPMPQNTPSSGFARWMPFQLGQAKRATAPASIVGMEFSPEALDEYGRYTRLTHAMQSGVAMDKDTTNREPKHLRVGINNALVSNSALGRLLIAKGVVSDVELCTALRDQMQEEVDSYRKRLAEQFGVPVDRLRLA